MGVLTIQFGQCGNQIGLEMFKYILNDIKEVKCRTVSKFENKDYINQSKQLWFSECKNETYTPRSVLVDTENKVINSLSNDSLKFHNIVTKSGGGSGNNWAYGYTNKAKMLVGDVLERVRREMEKSDDITHLLSFLSSGGGTGSGVGSRILESLRATYTNKLMLNVIVLPYKKGEIVTQSYNTLLTLAKLYDITDGSVIFQNDVLHSLCDSLMSIKNVDLSHMNFVIAQKLCSIFQPTKNNSGLNFVSHLTSHPNYKFIQLKSTPYVAREHVTYETAHNWPTLIGQMRKSLCANNNQLLGADRTPSVSERNCPALQYGKSVGSLLISRGGNIPHYDTVALLRDKELYATWIPEMKRLLHIHQPRGLYETEKFLTLATNNNTICTVLDEIIDQAWTLYNHKAYLHQYQKYDIGEKEFEVAFEKMEFVVNNYREI